MEDKLNYEISALEEKNDKEMLFLLLIYDIIDNKRRIKFAKFMESYGTRVQKSAFEIRISHKKIVEMTEKIPKYITNNDSVKLYKIRGNGEVMCWGTAKLEIVDDIIIL